MTNELTIFEPKTSIELLFTQDGVDQFFSEVKKYAEGFNGDITTEDGRAEIKAFERRIAKAKNNLDKQGKELTDDWFQKKKLVDIQRSRLKKNLEDLQEEVLKPVTEFENVEKKRIQDREDRIKEIGLLFDVGAADTVTTAEAKLKKAEELSEFDWQEFAERADDTFTLTKVRLLDRIQVLKDFEAKQKQLEDLQKQQDAQKQKDREGQIAKDAAANAEKEAEKKIADEKKRADTAEQDKKDAAAKAIKDAEAAATKAEEDKQKAVAAERKRQDDEKEAERLATEKRERNQKHRKEINNKALEAFVAGGLSEGAGKTAIELIAKGLIPNIVINY